MKRKLHQTRFSLITAFTFAVLHLFSQNNPVLQLHGVQVRTPLELSNGENKLVLQDLSPGNTYKIRVARAAQGQPVTLEIAPSGFSAQPVTEGSVLSAGKNNLQFTASADRIEFFIKATAEQQVSSVPVFLSVICETCPDVAIAKENPMAESMANLQVQDNISAYDLITGTLIGGDCFTVENVTSNGNALARGTFSNGTSNIGIGSGMVMSTGRINSLPGPNVSGGISGVFAAVGFDADLAALVDGDLHDVNIIEFDFTPTANTVQFDFVFGSEEYCEWVGTEFNDVFGFFISGPGIPGVQNLAVIPGTGGVPVTTNNINHNTNSNFYVNNSINLFECGFLGTNGYLECELDGWTKPLTAIATVVPCSTYHIKMAIADVEDHQYDSAVFLRANSFNAGGVVSASPAYQDDLMSAYEGCGQGFIRFARGNGDLSQALTIDFMVSGASTATAGVDYEALVSPVVIPAGQSEFLLPVNVFTDGIAEGQEDIILLIDNSCQCEQAEVQFVINDNLSFTASVYDTTICEGYQAHLFVIIEDGVAPFTYEWNTGDTSEMLIVTPLISTLYTVTVTDACGLTATDDALVDVIPILRDTQDVSLCAGSSIIINGIEYTSSTMVIDTTYGSTPCGEIINYILTFEDPFQGADTISFCAGTAIEIGGNLYTTDTTVVDTISTSAGCDSIVTYTLVQVAPSFGMETLLFCSGDAVEIGGNMYNIPGTVLDTLIAASGCDSIVTYTLDFLPNPMRSETVSLCPGDSVVIGGVTIKDPGSFLLYLPSALSCDTIVTYTITLLTKPTRAETIGFCPGETVTLGGNTYSQPGTVVVTAPATVGCDTIVTYTLQYRTPAPSTLSINCPNSISMNVSTGASEVVVGFADATASSDCVCPGLDVMHSGGQASGSSFPLGLSSVCYLAQDACGQTASCCFNISVEEEDPCDTKVIGCMKYELLTITSDQFKNKTYRIRVTNNCSNQLIYTAIQTPSGLVAMSPDNDAIYTAPSGNEYQIRNPNFSPFYSIRYRSIGGGIVNGGSDILRYTLPAQADVTYINITSRISLYQYYEAHLNTFYCPIGVTPAEERSEAEAGAGLIEGSESVVIFPNPTDGDINVDLSIWDGEMVQIQIFNSQGQRILVDQVFATTTAQHIDLPQRLSSGLYLLEVSTETGKKEVLKFAVGH